MSSFACRIASVNGVRPGSAETKGLKSTAQGLRAPLRFRQQAALQRLLVQARSDAKLDQAALADRLGITQSEVSKFERGERALDVVRLRAWLHALGADFPSFADALDRELARLEAQG